MDRPATDRSLDHLAQPRRRIALFQFSLETLLLVMTALAVGLGLWVTVPPLGVWFCLVGGLALVRTLVECRRFMNDGRQVLLGDKLNSFSASLGYSFLAVVCTMLVLGFLAYAAVAVVALIAWIAEAAFGPQVAGFAIPFPALVSFVGVIAAMGLTFYTIYWRTISPRLTLDLLPPHPTGPEGQSAR